nr:reverse transcriptase domain-containing protein [Tanacetum cinerariifolium]
MRVTIAFLRGEVAASNRDRRSHFHRGNNKKLDRSKTSRRKAFGTNKGHTTDECMHLKRPIKEMLKAGKLSHLIKELKQRNEKDQAKATKKGETLGKDKPLAILMVQPWHRGEEDGTKGPMIVDAEMGEISSIACICTGAPLQKSYMNTASIDSAWRTRSTTAHNRSSHRRKDSSINSPRIGSTLIEEGRKELCGLLRRNLDIFAWKPADMTGVLRHIA